MKFDELGEFNVNLIVNEEKREYFKELPKNVQTRIGNKFVEIYNESIEIFNKHPKEQNISMISTIYLVADLIDDFVKEQYRIEELGNE